MTVESKVNQGATFTLRLPIMNECMEALLVNWRSRFNPRISRMGGPCFLPRRGVKPSMPHQPQILIADDEPSIRLDVERQVCP